MGYKINIIGAGNVARNLAPALKRAGNEILQIVSRTEEPAKRLANTLHCNFQTDIAKLDPKADIILVCVNDDSITEVANRVQGGKQIVAHTSGGVSMKVLETASKHYGVLYPQQSFTGNMSVDLRQASFFVQGSDKKTRTALNELAHELSPLVYEVNDEQRMAVHITAVFANNFTHHLYVLAEELLKKYDLPSEILATLARQEFHRLLSGMELKRIQTGPAKRGEKKLLEEHLRFLEAHPEYAAIYQILSESIQKMYH